MDILIITPNYPNKYITKYPFVKQLVDEFVKQGHHCKVIAPYSIMANKGCYKQIEYVNDRLTIYRPNHLSFSTFHFFNLDLSKLFRQRAINRVLNTLSRKPDIVYCHFWECAVEGYRYAKSNKIPLFVATGESVITNLYTPCNKDQECYEYIKGVICVSTKNKDESIRLGLTSPDKCGIFPNSVNSYLFKKLDKIECRKRLGFPLDSFIIAFTGAFKDSKGPHRVANAIQCIKGKNVYSLFIGSGKIQPNCPNILFKGQLKHEDIPLYLNAADVFVLPTLAEGSCNAIVEAMACGLPIISSNLSFNWDVLDKSNSILVDPNNILEIKESIELLYENEELRHELSQGSLIRAKSLNITTRAHNIIQFVNARISNEYPTYLQ